MKPNFEVLKIEVANLGMPVGIRVELLGRALKQAHYFTNWEQAKGFLMNLRIEHVEAPIYQMKRVDIDGLGD